MKALFNDDTTYGQQQFSAFMLRLTLGVILLAHGLLKVFVFTIPGTVGYFASIGFPALFAYIVIVAEISAGLALIVGVLTRLVALLTLPILLGASWVHAGNGWVFSNEGGGWEFPVVLVVLAITVAIQGAGNFSLKTLFSDKKHAGQRHSVA